MIYAIFEFQYCQKPYTKFLLKRIEGLKDMVEEFQDGCFVLGNHWYANGMSLAISESPCCQKPSIKFLHKVKYGLEEAV